MVLNVWQRVKSHLPRAFRPTRDAAKDGDRPTISTARQHSLSVLSQQAKREAFLARKAAFTQFSVRTPFGRYSASKLAPVARLLPGLTLPAALGQMRAQLKKGARLFAVPLLHDAANAVRQRELAPADWVVTQAVVGRGRYRKRVDVKGRGRAGVIWRPSCFLRIHVAQRSPEGDLKKTLRRHVARVARRLPAENKPPLLRLRY